MCCWPSVISIKDLEKKLRVKLDDFFIGLGDSKSGLSVLIAQWYDSCPIDLKDSGSNPPSSKIHIGWKHCWFYYRNDDKHNNNTDTY